MSRIRRTHNVIEMPTTATAELPSLSDTARRAYQLYELRGRIDGHDLEDWFQAESELRQRDAPKAS